MALVGVLVALVAVPAASSSAPPRVLVADFDADVSPPTASWLVDRIHEARVGADVLGYLEFHIEQGPVLDKLGLPLGIVDAIAGQSRLDVVFVGAAGHAGTTPMAARRDALAAASEWIGVVEREARATPGLVATVGRVDVQPGAGEEEDDEHEDDGDEHDGDDPHVWHDVDNAKLMTFNIAEALSEVDPGNASVYDENARRYAAVLDETDAEEAFRRQLEDL